MPQPAAGLVTPSGLRCYGLPMADIATDWESTKRAVSDLCRELYADPGHGSDTSNHDLLTRVAEVRAAIHRSSEVAGQPRGAVVTVHDQLDKAASAWSERGSEAIRQKQAQ